MPSTLCLAAYFEVDDSVSVSITSSSSPLNGGVTSQYWSLISQVMALPDQQHRDPCPQLRQPIKDTLLLLLFFSLADNVDDDEPTL